MKIRQLQTPEFRWTSRGWQLSKIRNSDLAITIYNNRAGLTGQNKTPDA